MIDDDGGRAERLLELQQLEKGWLDGDGDTIDSMSIAVTRDLLDDFAAAGLPAPGVFPMDDGAVQLEWMLFAHEEAWEVVILGDDVATVSWMYLGEKTPPGSDNDVIMDERLIPVTDVVSFFNDRAAVIETTT